MNDQLFNIVEMLRWRAQERQPLDFEEMAWVAEVLEAAAPAMSPRTPA